MIKYVIAFPDGSYLKHGHTIPQSYWNRGGVLETRDKTFELENARIFNNRGAATNAYAKGKHGGVITRIEVVYKIWEEPVD